LRKLEKVLAGEPMKIPPLWLMRQAGRYLPEYRKIREKAGSFLDLCYTPELAIEVTLQPVKRFGFDAAILFSDILVVPDALGRKVAFVEGKGPVLEPLKLHEIDRLKADDVLDHLAPVFLAIRGLRETLTEETSLIGFCGAPWTVATYMIAGEGTSDQAPARLFAYQHPDAFEKLLNMLAGVSADYLVAQLRAGADVVQIFDSWAGILGPEQFERWCIDPVRKIVDLVREEIPDARIIGFPKGAGARYNTYREQTGVNAVGLDWTVPFDQAIELQRGGPVQGLLDPVRLVAGGQALDDGVDMILEHLGEGPLIFNLGHGITPQTPIAHVEQLVARVRRF